MIQPPDHPCPQHDDPSCRVCAYVPTNDGPVWSAPCTETTSHDAHLYHRDADWGGARTRCPGHTTVADAMRRAVCYCAANTLGHGFGSGACHAASPVPQQLPAEPCVEQYDPINHPQHYTSHPSGVECITVTEHMGFNLGNAVKYVWRADLKDDAIEDLRKAVWYLEREIVRREKATPAPRPAPQPAISVRTVYQSFPTYLRLKAEQ